MAVAAEGEEVAGLRGGAATERHDTIARNACTDEQETNGRLKIDVWLATTGAAEDHVERHLLCERGRHFLADLERRRTDARADGRGESGLRLGDFAD